MDVAITGMATCVLGYYTWPRNSPVVTAGVCYWVGSQGNTPTSQAPMYSQVKKKRSLSSDPTKIPFNIKEHSFELRIMLGLRLFKYPERSNPGSSRSTSSS